MSKAWLSPMEFDIYMQTLSRSVAALSCSSLMSYTGTHDLYALLGVPKTATTRDIEKAYRKEALKWHPDKWVGASDEQQRAAEERFKALSAAKETLCENRAEYDEAERNRPSEEGPSTSAQEANGMTKSQALEVFAKLVIKLAVEDQRLREGESMASRTFALLMSAGVPFLTATYGGSAGAVAGIALSALLNGAAFNNVLDQLSIEERSSVVSAIRVLAEDNLRRC